MQWTNEQQRAIETRDTNILLSAAAGSGKTTVLVARVLDLLTSGAADIDRMLIVTFTRAASADMRAKLSKSLGQRAAEGDETCRSQQLKLERASITTLHGFCADFLRTHFESAGVDPAFRILDETEARRLTDEAIGEAIEEAYEAPDARMNALDYGRGPQGVRAMVEALLRVLEERPDPEGWLCEICHPNEDLRKRWIGEMLSAARHGLDQAILLTYLALQSPDLTENYAAPLQSDLEALTRLRAIDDYSEMYRALCEFKQAPALRKKGCPPASDALKKLRSDAKAAVEKIALHDFPLHTALADAEALLPQLETLAQITLRARALLAQRKAELSGLSYSDLEHRTLQALMDDDTARAMREAYDYVFVDEYQDTSDVQEALIGRIVRGSNLFMVGDVKQSIYRFRQAEPRLFLEKYARYGAGDGGMLLPLTMNFRSEPCILEFVNHVFERAMHGGASEIVYDELARLNPGREACGGRVEVHLLNAKDAPEDENAAELKVCEREARFIGGQIRRMMREDPSLRYRDFAILMRTKRGVLGKMAAMLVQMGIPAFADDSEGYYDSIEIMLALSLIKLCVNRRSDVELIGVLRSPVVGLSNEELARIRIAAPEVPFVDAALEYAAREPRLQAFFDLLDRWRLMSACTDLGVLLRTMLEESGVYAYAGALPGGAKRQANLDRLISDAAAFDANISGALSRFLSHCEKLQERGESTDAPSFGESDDVVRLMTIHKSKGLEFPVVFGAMLSRRFSSGRKPGALSAHRDLGLGCLYCDETLQSRRKTLPQAAIAERSRREDQAEELRILYVLLTRAQKQLILIGSVPGFEGARARWTALMHAPDAANSCLDVIMPALIADEGRHAAVFEHEHPEAGNETDAAAPLPEISKDVPADEFLLRALSWQYPESEAARQPLKLTVTGLLREIQGPEHAEALLERPAFLSDTPAHMRGTERGTAYHRAMQCLSTSLLRAYSGRALVQEITNQLDLLQRSGRLRKPQREAIRPSALAHFFASDVGKRLLSAEQPMREWPFNVVMRISEALEPDEAHAFSQEEILVQGTIDCCFLENGRWILLDYKTDRTTDAEALTLRYRNQLRLYALALERITGIPVGEIWLCLLLAGENIRIPLNAEA